MNKRPTFKSQRSISNLLLLLFGGIGGVVAGICILEPALKESNIDFTMMILGSFVGLMGCLGLFQVIAHKSFEVNKNKILIKYIFGFTKIIDRANIKSWQEFQYKHGDKLVLKTNTGKIKIQAREYSNYELLRFELIYGKKLEESENRYEKNEDKNAENKDAAILFLIVAACFFVGSFFVYNKKDKKMSSLDLVTISGVVLKNDQKGQSSLQIKLKEYPEFKFNLSGVAYSSTSLTDYMNNTNIGDTISLDIELEEYEKKIGGKQALGFLDKVFDYSFISVYGLKDKDYIYLSLENYNTEKRSDNKTAFWSFIGLGCFFIGASLYGLMTGKYLVEIVE
ncbi:MAG TPA: hypothetical protein VGF79_15220 [Bacteroidia bacterium]